MRLFKATIVLLIVILASVDAEAGSPNKYALVIGNSAYTQLPLANPINDAKLMGASLNKIGFNVDVETDLNRKEIYAVVSEFSKGLPKDSVAFVYYAGHGLQIGGRNYLIPIDFTLTSEQGVPVRSYPVSDLLEQLGNASSSVNIVVLDACRNNPFRPLGQAKYRSFEGLGLAPVQIPKGTLIAYSTAPGQLAEDGKGRQNGLYAESLSKSLIEAGLPIERIFKQVAEQVRKQTLDDQQPWFESSLVNELVFKPNPSRPSGAIASSLPSTSITTPGKKINRTISASTDNAVWYLNLKPSEWAQLESDINQRVNHLTPDEIPLLEHRAKAGNVIAQTTLALAYKVGINRSTEIEPKQPGFLQSNVPRVTRYNANNTLSLKWLRKAASSGFPMAQAELGEMLVTGQGLDRNIDKATQWLQKAARADYPRARLDLAQIAIEQDPKSQGNMKALAEELMKDLTQK